MNIQISNSALDSVCLDDFQVGWRPHEDRADIILIDPGYPEIFLAAANDDSCQAAILAFTEEQKYSDREAFRKAVLATRASADNHSGLGLYYSREKGVYDLSGQLGPALVQLHDITLRHSFMSGDQETVTSIIENFGYQSAGKKHPKHSRPISNRVFFANGTWLKTNEGWHAVPEGDLLYMKADFEHAPNLQKTEGADFDKLLVLSRAQRLYNYD